MGGVKRPTKETIETALSTYYAEASFTDDLPEQEFLFNEIIGDSDELQTAIFCAAAFTRVHADSSRTVEEMLQEAMCLRDEVLMDEELLHKMRSILSMFFWVGWHARDAAEDEVTLGQLSS
jgi:hypothetical protein